MVKPTNTISPTNHVRPASKRRRDQEQPSFRWVSNPDLLLWCTQSKHILTRMSTPWSTKAGDTTFHTRVTHGKFGLIKSKRRIKPMDSNYTLFGSNRLEESSQRNDDSDMVEPMAPPSSDMFKARGSGKSRSGIEAFHTRTQAEAPRPSFPTPSRCFIKPQKPRQRSSKAWIDLQTSGSDSSMFSTSTSVMKKPLSLNANLVRAHLLLAFLGGAAARSEDPSRAHIPRSTSCTKWCSHVCRRIAYP